MGCLFDDADIGKQYANVPCTCVHKIYVKILYIIHKIHHPFNHKWDQESNQDHPGLREGPVGMGNAIRGDENHDFIKVTSWSKSIEVWQFESILLFCGFWFGFYRARHRLWWVLTWMGSAVLVAIDIHTFHLAGLKCQRQEKHCAAMY